MFIDEQNARYMKQNLIELTGKADKSITQVSDFSTPLPTINRIIRKTSRI